MKPIPPFPPKTFHRIHPGNARTLNEAIAKRTTDIVSADLASKFELGDGLVVASWDGFGLAKVEALGIVVEINASKEREVEWIRVQFELPGSDRPRGGSQFWKQPKPTFRFVDGVAEEFRLKQFFTKYLTDPFAASRGETA